MIEGLFQLLMCQLVGTLLSQALHLPIPGPVAGMLFLLAILTVRRSGVEAPVMRAGGRILQDLPLLFIPAGVGLVTCLGLLRHQWLPIGAAMLLGWAAGLLGTVFASRGGLARNASDPDEGQ